jgi:hypothetical protein
MSVTAEQATEPLPEYATLTTVFTGVLGGFVLLARRRLPERVGWGDVARIGLASYKVGRLVAKDEVTKFVRAPVTRDEEASEPEPRGWAARTRRARHVPLLRRPLDCGWIFVRTRPLPARDPLRHGPLRGAGNRGFPQRRLRQDPRQLAA